MYPKKIASQHRSSLRKVLRKWAPVFKRLATFVMIFTCVYLLFQSYYSWKEATRQRKDDQRRAYFNKIHSSKAKSKPSTAKLRLTTNKDGLCPEVPPDLIGNLNITLEEPTFAAIAKRNPLLRPGGYYRPPNCRPRNGPTVFVIPYRGRPHQLRILLNHLHPLLQRQQLEYMIVVAEQGENETFNRGLMMNIGYNESLGLLPDNREFQCCIFHDVDLLPEKDNATFTCKKNPVHFCGYLDKHGYKVLYGKIFGGATGIPKWIFDSINGYSNLYFGWGGEDDDIRRRVVQAKFKVDRPPKAKLTYRMIKHNHERSNKRNPNRRLLVREGLERMTYDGLNSLTYRVRSKQLLPTHVHVIVDFTRTEVEEAVFRRQKPP